MKRIEINFLIHYCRFEKKKGSVPSSTVIIVSQQIFHLRERQSTGQDPDDMVTEKNYNLQRGKSGGFSNRSQDKTQPISGVVLVYDITLTEP